MTLSIWTIYDHPKDLPDFFVARRFEIDKPTEDVIVASYLDTLRERMVDKGLTRIYRSEDDDPVIVETWL